MAVNTIEKTKPAKEVPAPSDGWKSMEECPHIVGRAIEIKSAKGEVEVAKWRITRSINPTSMRWENDSFWATINAGGIKVKFEPIAWREVKE
jgi:hypothetical protein